MDFDQIFFDDTDEEEEVNSLVFEFFKDAATLLQASTYTTPKIPRKPIARDRHGAHDCLVAAYFTEQSMYTPKQFRLWSYMARSICESLKPKVKNSMLFTRRNISFQPDSNDVKRIRYKQANTLARKDVERAFDVLKKKWATIKTSARLQSLDNYTIDVHLHHIT
ncbi:hypothetical protein Tco_0441413 [Tanacetum coccineum]